MRTWLEVIAGVALLGLAGCGGKSNGSSSEPNLRRCQSSCTVLCTRCSPCNMDDCVNICLGTTDGLEAVCAECVVMDPTYSVTCVPTFKSTASSDCAPVCTAPRADAAVD